MSVKERLLAVHRDGVSGIFNRWLSVYQVLLVLHSIELAFLIMFWTVNYIYSKKFDSNAYTVHCIVHTCLTLLAPINLVPGTLWLYVSLPIHLFKFWHMPFFWGMAMEKIYAFVTSYLLADDAKVMLDHYLTLLVSTGGNVALGSVFAKVILSFMIIWYTLVLERIRVAGGTGWERKSAMELELEAKIQPGSETAVGSDELELRDIELTPGRIS